MKRVSDRVDFQKAKAAMFAAFSGREWTPWHWVAATAPCGFIAINSFFSTGLLAANEGFRFLAAPEFLLRLLGFCAWSIAFRFAWMIERAFDDRKSKSGAVVFVAHAATAATASMIFIFLFSPIFFALQYPGHWREGLAVKVFQVWLEHSGLLLLSYFLAVAAYRWIGRAEAGRSAAAPKSRIEIAADGVRRVIGQDEIVWVEAMGNYAAYHTSANALMARNSLQAIEAELDPSRFFRTHRRAIVNLDAVKSFRRTKVGSYEIDLIDGGVAPLSRQRLSAFRERMTRPPDRASD